MGILIITGPYIYPRGMAILLFIAAAHFDPRFYPNPYNFNPENFSPDAVSKRPKFTFLPFSAGRRDCLGNFSNFAINSPKFQNIKWRKLFQVKILQQCIWNWCWHPYWETSLFTQSWSSKICQNPVILLVAKWALNCGILSWLRNDDIIFYTISHSEKIQWGRVG